MDGRSSRRAVLRSGIAATGLGIVGSLAGCSQLDGLLPGNDSADDGSNQGGTTSNYQQWLPAPDAFESDHYYFEAVDYDGLQANESHFADSVYSDYAEQDLFRELEIPVGDIEAAIFVGLVADGSAPAVVRGDFSRADVTSKLTEFGYEEQSAVGEYAVYVGESAVGVRDGRLVFSDAPERRPVDAILDAKSGDAPRYGESSGNMRTLLDRLGTGTFVYGATRDAVPPADASPVDGAFAGNVGFAYQDTVDRATTRTEISLLFESAGDVDMDAISTYTNGDLFAEYSSVSSSQDGRVVSITGTTPTGALYDY
jgi:hypothetical protein